MGFKKPLSLAEIQWELMKAHREICSSYSDGFTQFEIKKELYDIKWLLEELLKRQPTFSGEEEWLVEQEKKKVWSELKR